MASILKSPNKHPKSTKRIMGQKAATNEIQDTKVVNKTEEKDQLLAYLPKLNVSH